MFKVENLTKNYVLGSHYPNGSAAVRAAKGMSRNNDDVFVITDSSRPDYSKYISRGEETEADAA